MEKMRVSLGAVGLWDRFDPYIFSCYDTGTHKPDPGVYLHAMAAFGAAPHDCLVVEDTVNGVTAGAASGAFVVAFERDTSRPELEAAGASVVVGDLAAVATVIDRWADRHDLALRSGGA